MNVESLVRAGIRTFINLMEEGETDDSRQRSEPYDDRAREICPNVSCHRFPIEDLAVPSAAEMGAILTTIDDSLAATHPTYVHYWGGVGRTGTVIGCWLLRHELAEPDNVLNVLAEIRKQDRERRHRMSPETVEHQKLVQHSVSRQGTWKPPILASKLVSSWRRLVGVESRDRGWGLGSNFGRGIHPRLLKASVLRGFRRLPTVCKEALVNVLRTSS